jgi:hypothetical protein
VRRTAPLYDTAGRTMDEIKRKCAHWRAELEIAEWAAKRELEGASVRGRRLSPEQAEVGGRLLRRSVIAWERRYPPSTRPPRAS